MDTCFALYCHPALSVFFNAFGRSLAFAKGRTQNLWHGFCPKGSYCCLPYCSPEGCRTIHARPYESCYTTQRQIATRNFDPHSKITTFQEKKRKRKLAIRQKITSDVINSLQGPSRRDSVIVSCESFINIFYAERVTTKEITENLAKSHARVTADGG